MRGSGIKSERGSISPLIIGVVLIGALLLGVIADSARVFLVHRELVRLADSTALAAATALDLNSYYSTGSVGSMPLDRDGAWQIAQRWVAQSQSSESQIQNVQISSFAVEAGTINITLSANVPERGFYSIGRSHVVTISGSASASSVRK